MSNELHSEESDTLECGYYATLPPIMQQPGGLAIESGEGCPIVDGGSNSGAQTDAHPTEGLSASMPSASLPSIPSIPSMSSIPTTTATISSSSIATSISTSMAATLGNNGNNSHSAPIASASSSSGSAGQTILGGSTTGPGSASSSSYLAALSNSSIAGAAGIGVLILPSHVGSQGSLSDQNSGQRSASMQNSGLTATLPSLATHSITSAQPHGSLHQHSIHSHGTHHSANSIHSQLYTHNHAHAALPPHTLNHAMQHNPHALATHPNSHAHSLSHTHAHAHPHLHMHSHMHPHLYTHPHLHTHALAHPQLHTIHISTIGQQNGGVNAVGVALAADPNHEGPTTNSSSSNPNPTNNTSNQDQTVAQDAAISHSGAPFVTTNSVPLLASSSLPTLNPGLSSSNKPSSSNSSSSSSSHQGHSALSRASHALPGLLASGANTSLLTILDSGSANPVSNSIQYGAPGPSTQVSAAPNIVTSLAGPIGMMNAPIIQSVSLQQAGAGVATRKRTKRTVRAASLTDSKSEPTSDCLSTENDWSLNPVSSLPHSLAGVSSKDKTEFPVDEKGNLCVDSGEVISGRYLVDSVLGEGTFSRVLKAFDLLERNFVALKIIKKQYTRNSTHESAQLQLLNENDPHDSNGIVRLKGQFYCNIQHCMVLELGSCTLLDVIKSQGKLPIEQVALYGRQILRSLAYISNFNIIHCDLKPENILVFLDSSVVKLSDFGSSCLERRFMPGSYIQSRYYRAPEILLELAHDRSIDMWSCGCIFMEMATGKPLFAGTSVLDQICKISEVCGLPPDYMIKESLVLSKFFFDDRGRYRLKKASPSLPPGTIEFPHIETLSGTRWVIKESKTHPGSFYYVNTATGASQWERPIIKPLDELTKQAYPDLGDAQRDSFLDLVRRMLSYDQLTRINPEEAHNHGFFNYFPTYHQPTMMKRRKANGAV
eukprot:TRINITY_DN7485_c2_g1_i2.p1 TRINITY_DN7485_c2_g1~~TRINITY_DN7485_c2_g1_i2.p1  ORF type:complete len:941 (+),score=161.29 TRINITY_DN7485_c2_g1_i2:19-2841(+)